MRLRGCLADSGEAEIYESGETLNLNERGGSKNERKLLVPSRGLCSSSAQGFQPLQSHIRNIHPDFLEEKGPASEVPIVEEDFTTAEPVRVSIPTVDRQR